MITSESNAQIKEIIKLQKQTKARRKSHSFVVEGFKMLNEAASYDKLKKVYVSEYVMEREDERLKDIISRCPYEEVSDNVFKQMSDTVTPQGVIGIADMPEYSLDSILGDDRKTWLLLDDLRDPGNLGTIMRTSEGADMSGVILSKESVDLFNPKVVRSTMGAIFRMPYIYVDSLVDTIGRIKNMGYKIYGTAMEGSVVYDKPDYTKGAGFVIGNEANGVSDEVFAEVTDRIRIPMGGKLESLNAAVAAAIVMYEAARQKRNTETR